MSLTIQKKYFIPDTYPMIEEMFENFIVLNEAEDVHLPNTIYVPWQLVTEATTIGFNDDEEKIQKML